jgi:hypothetical protein
LKKKAVFYLNLLVPAKNQGLIPKFDTCGE